MRYRAANGAPSTGELAIGSRARRPAKSELAMSETVTHVHFIKPERSAMKHGEQVEDGRFDQIFGKRKPPRSVLPHTFCWA